MYKNSGHARVGCSVFVVRCHVLFLSPNLARVLLASVRILLCFCFDFHPLTVFPCSAKKGRGRLYKRLCNPFFVNIFFFFFFSRGLVYVTWSVRGGGLKRKILTYVTHVSLWSSRTLFRRRFICCLRAGVYMSIVILY